MRWSLLVAFAALPVFAQVSPPEIMPPPDDGCTVSGDTVILRWGYSILLDRVIPGTGFIAVQRDNERIATLPPGATSYVDRHVPAGRHDYVVSAFMGDIVALLLKCSVVVRPYPPPQDLRCQVLCELEPLPEEDPATAGLVPVPPPPRACHVKLTWTNPVPYRSIVIARNGRCVAVLPGDREEWTDRNVPAGIHRYQVAGIIPDILPLPAQELLNGIVDDPQAGQASDVLSVLCPYWNRLSKSAECTVEVPGGPIPGPSNLICIPIEVDNWREIPELAQVPIDDLPRPPFRGVLLIWRNNAPYDAVVVQRDDRIIARLPGSAWYYLDGNVSPGKHLYQVRGLLNGQTTAAARCIVEVPGPQILPPPQNLTCRVICPIRPDETEVPCRVGEDCDVCPARNMVALSWRNPTRYDAITVTRDGEVIAELPGAATSYIDRHPPAGLHVYGVRGRRGNLQSKEPRCRVEVPPQPPVIPPRNLTCLVVCATPEPPGVVRCAVQLKWENGQAYEKIAILRDGEILETIEGASESYTDRNVPHGTHVYGVAGIVGDLASRPALCKVQVPPPPLRPPYDLVCIPGIGPEPVPPPIVVPGEDEVVIPIPVNAVFLRWRNGSQYDRIMIRRDSTEIARLPGTATSYTDLNVPEGEHLYAVTGLRDGVETEPAECKVVVGEPVPPPQNLTCTVMRAEEDNTSEPGILGPSVLLRWELPVGIAGAWAPYNAILIFRNGSLVARLEGTATEYLDRGLLPGTYKYGVVGVRGGHHSLPAHCTVEVPGPLPPPQRLTCHVLPLPCMAPIDCPPGFVRLTWRNPVKYVQILITRNGEQIAQLGGDQERFLDRDITPGEKYRYEVAGVGEDGQISESAVCEVEVPPFPPPPPYDLTCEVKDGTVVLAWQNGGQYTAIVIVRDNDKIAELQGGATSYEDQSVEPGRHCYLVFGVGEDGTRTAPARCCVVVPGPSLDNILYFANPEDTASAPTGEAICMGDNKDPVEAWSFGVCNDPTQIRPVEATVQGTFVEELQPGYLAISTYRGGVTMAAIVQVVPEQDQIPPDEQPVAIEPGSGRSLLHVTYEAVNERPDPALENLPDRWLYRIHYCSRLGDPPVAVLYVVEGMEVVPKTVPGVVRIPPPPPIEFIRGDANGDGAVDIGDVIFTLYWLFASGEKPPCLAAADANATREVNIADAVFLLNMLFQGGPEPPAPYPDCGPYDPARDRLPCESSPGCNN